MNRDKFRKMSEQCEEQRHKEYKALQVRNSGLNI
jgi:hypothetical protein